MDDKYKERLREIYPSFSDEKLLEAAQNLDAYLELAWDVFEELASEKKAELRKPEKRVDAIYREFDSSQGSAQDS